MAKIGGEPAGNTRKGFGMKEFDLQEIIRLAWEAGQIAKKHFNYTGARRKPDNTVVTDADQEIELLVRERLAELTPGFGVLGEESGRSGNPDKAAPCWVVDPLDGTSSFVSGLPNWAFSLGLIEEDSASFGLVYLPLLDEMYYLVEDGRVFKNGEPVKPVRPAPLDGESVLYVPSDWHQRFTIRFPGKLRSLGSAAYHGLLVSRPLTAGVLQGRIYLWDAAAILALNRAWGMRVATLDGREVKPSSWSAQQAISDPILFAAPELFERLAGMIHLLEE